jgi:hypothetical protein
VSSNGGSFRAVEGKKESKSRKTPLVPTIQPLHAIENTKDADEHKLSIAAIQNLPARLDIIANLPTVACPKLDSSQNMFDRDFLKCALGDGVRTLLTQYVASH